MTRRIVTIAMGAALAVIVVTLVGIVLAGDPPSKGPGSANTEPTVSNVQVQPRADNSHLIDIWYDLTEPQNDPCAVWILVSKEGGPWTLPARSFVNGSAIGVGVTPGNGKRITWDAAADIPGISGTMRIRVRADDGIGGGLASQLGNSVLVPAGPPPSSVNAVWIDREQATNRRYCDYLNQFDPTGAHWNSNMKITRHGSVTPYAYMVMAEYADTPAEGLAGGDQTAYLAWLSTRMGVTCRAASSDEWSKAQSLDGSLSGLVGFRVAIPVDQW
ncbi:MAG TPA: hypothetical protein PKY77_19680 [Phycisphaerae bacterium]|nr:hypothetical protein [Phycisphaerae bacterium]HRY70702.1 hypothetical protein [Phycisphaerae bacterium]HSA28703.1 hypothetical protein [Phycisphaerae bacterium]